MELKLLQEKDIEKHGQIDQLEKVKQMLFSSSVTEFLLTRIFWPLKTVLTTINRATRRKSKNFPQKNKKGSLLSMG